MSESPGDPARPSPRGRRNTRPRDALGRPLPYGAAGVAGPAEGLVRSPRESLREAQSLLAAGRPFHAHEVLEDAWKSGPEDEREFWRALAQLAVGATHAARGNIIGARRLIERARLNLTPYANRDLHDVEVTRVLRWCDDALAQLAGESPVLLSPPPLVPRPDVERQD